MCLLTYFIIFSLQSNNGKYIASGSVDGTACVFDVSQGKIIHTIEAHSDTVRSVAFSPKSDMLATASNDGYVKLFVVYVNIVAN